MEGDQDFDALIESSKWQFEEMMKTLKERCGHLQKLLDPNGALAANLASPADGPPHTRMDQKLMLIEPQDLLII